MFSTKNDIILDPFAGSGTTAEVAMQNERNSIGYETDKNLIPTITKKVGAKTSKVTDVKIVER
jgi:DNA modification methylase